VAASKDFYCDDILSGRTPITRLAETRSVLAFYHTSPAYPVHIVVIPKRHVSSLITLQEEDNDLLTEMLSIIKSIAADIVAEHGACRVITNLGEYQDSKHLHWHIVSGERRDTL
jgi:histidine triad (HIT) family protein